MRTKISITLSLKRNASAMLTHVAAPSPRKATNVSLPADLLAEAKALNINISQASEAGLARAVAEKRSALWLASNKDALDSSNAFVEREGLPLSKHRQF